MSDIRKVAVLDTGVLGSQIAFQTAYSGFDVVAYDISEEALEQARQRFAMLVETYGKEVAGAAVGDREKGSAGGPGVDDGTGDDDLVGGRERVHPALVPQKLRDRRSKAVMGRGSENRAQTLVVAEPGTGGPERMDRCGVAGLRRHGSNGSQVTPAALA